MILVTGGQGQLGAEFKKLLHADQALILSHEECNIADRNQVEQIIKYHSVKSIINCAAYTNVDKSELEQDMCYRVNRDGPGNLAFLAKKYSIPLVHISTDYVFDGTGNIPLKETDKPNPINVYGLSKLAGENEVLKYSPEGVIIRTSWLYSTYLSERISFVKKILDKAKETKCLRVVCDQVGSPTYSYALACAIIEILPQIKSRKCELYHFASQGEVTWYEFACEICRLANVDVRISPVSSEDYPTSAKRPRYSVLSSEKMQDNFDIIIPHWKDSLAICMKEHL